MKSLRVRNTGVPSSTKCGVVATPTERSLPENLRKLILSYLNNLRLQYRCEYAALSHALCYNCIIGPRTDVIQWLNNVILMNINEPSLFIYVHIVLNEREYTRHSIYLDINRTQARLEELRQRLCDIRSKLLQFGPAFPSDNAGDGPQDWGPFLIDRDRISVPVLNNLPSGRVAAIHSPRQTIGYAINVDGLHIYLKHVKFLNRLQLDINSTNAYVHIIPVSSYANIIHGDCVKSWSLGIGGSNYIRHKSKRTIGMVYKVSSNIYRLYAFDMEYVEYISFWLKRTDLISVEIYQISPATVIGCLQHQAESNEYMIKLVEDIMMLVYSLSKCEGVADVSFCALNFIKMRSNISIYKAIRESEIMDRVYSIFEWSPEEPEQQSFAEFVESCRNIVDNFEIVHDTPIVKKITRLMYYCLTKDLLSSFGITFDNLRYNILEREAMKRKYSSRASFALHLADFIVFLCERGIQVYNTGDPSIIFHSSVTYTKFKKECDVLQRQFKNIGRAEVLGFTEEDFDHRLEKAIQMGTSIEKYGGGNHKIEQRVIINQLNGLKLISDERMIMKSNEEERDLPFSILICGNSGIGKGTIKDILFKCYADHHGLPRSRDCRYTRTPDQEFWPDYKTHKYCVVLDDIAFMAPKFAMGIDPTVRELLRIVNTVPWITPQADLESKGKIPLRCKLVLATTNTEHLNAYYYFSCPSAVQRRFPYVVIPTVHPNYARTSGDLDTSKTDPNKFPDYWLWTVKEVLPQCCNDRQSDLAITNTLLKDVDLPTFLKWYHKAMDNHDNKVCTINKNTETIYEAELCKICYSFDCDGHEQSLVPSSVGWHSFMYNAFIFFWYLFVFKFIDLICTIVDIPLIRTALVVYDRTCRLERFVVRWMHYIANQKRFWTDLGARAYSRIGFKTRLVATIAAEIIVLYGLLKCQQTMFRFGMKAGKKIFGKSKPEDEDLKSEQSGVAPVPDGVEVQNVWYQKEFGLSVLDVSLATRSLQKAPPERLVHMFQHNIVNFICKETRQRTGGLCVKGHIYVVNAHFIPDLPEFTLKMKTNENSISPNIVFEVKQSEIHIDREMDIAILIINKVPPRKDITDYILREEMDIRANGLYIIRDANGTLSHKPVEKIQPQSITNRSIKCHGWKSYVDIPTKQGDCGSPLIMMSAKGPIIVGIHALGFSSEAYSVMLSLSYLSKYVNLDDDVGVEMLPLQSDSAPRELTSLHPKSIFRYFSGGIGEVYGTFVGHKAHGKTNVKPTPICESITEKFNVKVNFTKPVMNDWRPWRIAAKDLLSIPTNLDLCKLEDCIQGYISDVSRSLPDSELSKLEVYTDFVAVNGALGVAHVDSMKLSTSAGNPFRRSKRYYIQSVPEQDGLADAVMPSAEILSRVRMIEKTYRDHKCVRPNFCAHLKDEPVSFKKADIGKTRVFTGAPFDWTIVVRKYLLSTIRVIQRNRLLFEAGPGTVAQSTQWEEIYHYLTQFGNDRIVAGDYKAFDKRMAPEFILAAFRIIRHLCEKSGNFSKEDLFVIDCVANDTAFPLVDFNGDLIQLFGSNPSGHPLTVIINSIVNSLYIRYCYISLNPEGNLNDFKKNVALMTYGDDNIMGVSPDIPWFNHTTISESLKELDVVYTMADKEAKSVPYINIDEATFLKRSWRFDPDVGAIVAPLEFDSIFKSLTVWTRSKAVVEQEQLISVVASAVREFFWHGKDIFIQNSIILKQILHNHGYGAWIEEWVFPTYDELRESFWEVSEKLSQH